MTQCAEKISPEKQIKRIQDIIVKGKTILLRADLNVPVKGQKITDATRIIRLQKTVNWLIDQKARKVILISHFGRPKGEENPDFSLRFATKALELHFGYKISFYDQFNEKNLYQKIAADKNNLILLENLRFSSLEEENDLSYAKQLAELADLYVNDAFSVSHRAHSSVEAITNHLPSYAGFLLQEEVDALNSALESPKKPVLAIIGGAKISTKLDLLNNLIKKVDYLCLGGGMANTFLKAKGVNIGGSLHEDSMLSIAQQIMQNATQENCEVILPIDARVAAELVEKAPSEIKDIEMICDDDKIFDIGEKSIQRLIEILGKTKTVLWNGPLGVFEIPPFDLGTTQLAKKVATLTKEKKLASIAGGGDTVAALNHAKVSQDFTYISSAGGAFLEWCEGKSLPGIEVLKA